jgi:replicative DNA helicase
MTDLRQQEERPNIEHLEKYFFAYIMENPSYFNRVDPISFDNHQIAFVYKVIQDHYLKLDKPIIPSNHKILELVRMYDTNKKISKDFLKALLDVDVGNVVQGADDDYLSKAVQSWCTSSTIKQKMYEAADFIRDLNPIDYQNTEVVASKIRELINAATLMDFDNEDLGLDFDDPESHLQDTKRNKIPTGWHNLDELMQGGWDTKTLNIVIGPSNSGKSVWLSNIAVNAANYGKNVMYFSLEMSDKKVMKRLGAIRLKIPIDDYDEKSKDKKYMQSQLKKLKSSSAEFGRGGDLFNNQMGKIFVKEYHAGTATVADLDAHIKKIQEVKGVKIDMVVVDYLTIMSPDNKGNSSLFQNGKQLSEGLRAIGQKYEIAMVTAMQVSKDNFGASDIFLSDISESKAIVETADTMFGIIRTDKMRAEGKYILKLLKMRDGDFKWEKTQFDLNKKFLNIENDTKL